MISLYGKVYEGHKKIIERAEKAGKLRHAGDSSQVRAA